MRLEVLNVYRRLHRVCQRIYNGDITGLTAARLKIRIEFLKNKNVTDLDKISQLVMEAIGAEKFLRERVVQAVQDGDDEPYRMKIRPETILENSPPMKH
jgi:hypothetical protein